MQAGLSANPQAGKLVYQYTCLLASLQNYWLYPNQTLYNKPDHTKAQKKALQAWLGVKPEWN